MIYPMMVQIDFSAIKDVTKKPKGIVLTLVVNWLIEPSTMAPAWLVVFPAPVCRLGQPTNCN